MCFVSNGTWSLRLVGHSPPSPSIQEVILPRLLLLNRVMMPTKNHLLLMILLSFPIYRRMSRLNAWQDVFLKLGKSSNLALKFQMILLRSTRLGTMFGMKIAFHLYYTKAHHVQKKSCISTKTKRPFTTSIISA